MDDVFNSALKFAEAMNKLYIKKQDAIKLRRKKAQNNPLTKQRKSRSMKEYWKKKKAKQKYDEEMEEARANYRHESCYCHLGNPPCGWCTDTNYCEECDEKTWDDECPKCGKYLV